jgi:toxin YoeB
MKLLWTEGGWSDYLHWLETDRDVLRRINALIKDIQRSPFAGIGKPEPLGGDLAGWWSRRITGDHRLVYRITGAGVERRVEIARCRYHYARRR